MRPAPPEAGSAQDASEPERKSDSRWWAFAGSEYTKPVAHEVDVHVRGTPVAGLGYERAIGVIRGPEGTTVVLRIRRDGRETDVVVTRKRVRH